MGVLLGGRLCAGVSRVTLNSAHPYVLGGQITAEGRRLVEQARGLEREALWLLDKVEIRNGCRAVDASSQRTAIESKVMRPFGGRYLATTSLTSSNLIGPISP